jgi:hypothetical protein
MGQYSAKETIIKLREFIIPHPREDETVNKLSHDTVPLNQTQSVHGVQQGSPYRAKYSKKVPLGALPRFEPVLIPLPYIRQAGAFYPMS